MPALKNMRQEKFCREYIKHSNPTKALRDAGYTPKSENTAASTASQLLKTPKVVARLNELAGKIAEKTTFDQARILNELGRLALSDTRKLFNEDGTLKPPQQWDDATAAAVAGLEFEKIYEKQHGKRVEVGTLTKVKLWDKNTALTNLAKYFKILFNGPSVGINVQGDLTLQVGHSAQVTQQRLLKLIGSTHGHADRAPQSSGAAG